MSSAAWTAIAQFATGSYSVGQIVRPLTAPAFNAQYAFRCTTAGSASAEPAWPAANNATVTATGGAIFTNVTGQATYGWSAAAGNLYSITTGGSNRFAVGDRCFLSSDHSETNSTATSIYAFTSSAGYGLIQCISVNRAGSVPPVAGDAASGATINLNGTGSQAIDCVCNIYWQGVKFALTSSAASLFLSFNGTRGHYFRNCAFQLAGSTATAAIGSDSNGVSVIFDNTTVQFNNAGQRLLASAGTWELRWINTPSAILGTVPTTLLLPGASAAFLVSARGVDFSAVTTTLVGGATSSIKVLLDSCQINSGVVRLGSAAQNNSSDEVELVNCFDGTNANIGERHTLAGDLTTDRSTTLVGGAQDDVGLFAHKLISSTRCDGFTLTLDSFWLDCENTFIGVSRTATVEIIGSASLNNTDISLVLEYLGTSGSSLASFTSTLSSALTASSAVASSTVTWNNPPSTPVKQHLTATFTPQTAGRVRGLVRLGKASTTVWINPQIIVT